jgi:hypothetical protein
MGIDRQVGDDWLRLKAQRAYERGRWWHALQIGWLVVPLACCSALMGHRYGLCLGLSLLLWAVASGFRWYGRDLARSVLPGMGFGALILPMGLFVQMGWLAPVICQIGCLAFCAGCGILSGACMVLWLRRTEDTTSTVLIGAGVISGLTGALCCLPLGLASGATILATVFLSTTTTAFLQPRFSM